MNFPPIFEAIFTLLAIIATTVLVLYIKSRMTVQQQAELASWVRTAVEAAEQIYAGSGRGAEKKAYVLDWLTTHGITTAIEKLDVLIEAAVYAMKAGVVT